MPQKTCFVVMGFGKKTDYQSGRVLDLDKSYRNIIKPAAEEAGLQCRRADEIVHSGLIDTPMYDQLLTADVVIADISTSNANAFYELGVRHALRPFTTITIAEDKMLFPFDVSHLAIRTYKHLGEGIDFDEVVRMRTALTEAIKTILDSPTKDSPVYTFFSDLDPPARRLIEKAVAQASPHAFSAAQRPDDVSSEANPSMSVLMQQAQAAIQAGDFETARTLLRLVRKMSPSDPYVVQRLAFATYQSGTPDVQHALNDAVQILSELQPETSADTETLGLWGAVHKRLWDLTKQPEDMERSLSAYEKGFYLKNDYYNGINLAFLYDLRASSTEEGSEAAADRVLSQRTRKRVVTICENLLASSVKLPDDERYWILASLAEAYTGLGDDAKAAQVLLGAKALNPPAWMDKSTTKQLERVKALRT